MRLSTLSRENRLRNEESFPTCKDWTYTDWACALSGEVGELCNFLKKLRRGDKVNIEDIGKELADVVIYTDLIATYFKIDLPLYIANKFNEVSKRVDSPRRLDIYDEYEMAAIYAENKLNDALEYIKMKDLDEDFNEWIHEHDEEKAF